jgi:uncharacterized protein YbjQ (UPF0145 family)
MSPAGQVRLLSRVGEPQPDLDEDLGPVQVERRIRTGFREAVQTLMSRRRRRAPGWDLVEAIKAEAARLGANGVVDVRVDSRTARGELVIRLRGRAVRTRDQG